MRGQREQSCPQGCRTRSNLMARKARFDLPLLARAIVLELRRAAREKRITDRTVLKWSINSATTYYLARLENDSHYLWLARNHVDVMVRYSRLVTRHRNPRRSPTNT